MNLPSFQFVLDVMHKAGLTPTEMIKLMPVGRATFYNWKRGQTISDLLRYRLTVARCIVIKTATENGRLPLPEGTPYKRRQTLIEKIVKETRSG